VVVSCDGQPTVRCNLKSGEVELAMPDGTRIVRTCPKSTGIVTLSHPDGTSLCLEAGGKAQLKPTALAHFHNQPEEIWGTYNFHLEEGSLHTQDSEGNKFELGLNQVSNVELVLKDDLAADIEADVPTDATAKDDPEWCHPPRLLVCRPDGSGAELWRHADIRGFLKARAAGIEAGVSQEQHMPFPADPEAVVVTHVWRDEQTLRNDTASEVAESSDARTIAGMRPKRLEPRPEHTLLHYRRLVKRAPLSNMERDELEQELESMEKWRSGEEETATELHIADIRSPEEKAREMQVQMMLQANVGPGA